MSIIYTKKNYTYNLNKFWGYYQFLREVKYLSHYDAFGKANKRFNKKKQKNKTNLKTSNHISP